MSILLIVVGLSFFLTLFLLTIVLKQRSSGLAATQSQTFHFCLFLLMLYLFLSLHTASARAKMLVEDEIPQMSVAAIAAVSRKIAEHLAMLKLTIDLVVACFDFRE